MLQELLVSGLLDRSPAKENLESAWPRANFEYFHETIEEYLLIEHEFDVNSRYKDGRTLLMNLFQGSPWFTATRVKELLDYMPDLELTDDFGRTALQMAVDLAPFAFKVDTFNMLIQHGARVDYKIEDGGTISRSIVDRIRRVMGTVERLSRRSIRLIEGISHNDLRSLDLDARDSCGYPAFDILMIRTRLLRKKDEKLVAIQDR